MTSGGERAANSAPLIAGWFPGQALLQPLLGLVTLLPFTLLLTRPALTWQLGRAILCAYAGRLPANTYRTNGPLPSVHASGEASHRPQASPQRGWSSVDQSGVAALKPGGSLAIFSTHHPDKSCLKDEARSNMPSMLVTLLVSQPLIGPLKLAALLNIPRMSTTLLVSQRLNIDSYGWNAKAFMNM